MTRLVPALTGAAVAVLVAGAAAGGTAPLVAALVLLTVLLAWGWAALLGLPSPRGSRAVVALSGAVSVGVVAVSTDPPYLRWLPSALALSVLAEFTHQLLRRDMRPRLVESVTGVVTAVVVAAMAAGWLGALRLHGGPFEGLGGGLGVVLIGAAAAFASTLATGMPWPQRVTGPSAVLAGLAFAALVGRLLPDYGALGAAALGAAVGVVTAALDRMLAVLPASRQVPAALAAGTAPVAASGLVVYVLGRLLG